MSIKIINDNYNSFFMEPINLSASAIIENNRLLLLWKIKANHYEFPGGKVEVNEELKDAAIRETEEEIGCSPELIEYFGHYDFEKDKKLYQSHIFLAKIKDDEIPKIMEPKNIDEMVWIPIKEHDKYKLANNVHKFCKDYKEKHLS